MRSAAGLTRPAKPSSRSVLVVLTATAFGLRIAWQIGVGYYRTPVVWEPGTIADNLLSGRGYVIEFLGSTWTGFSAPAYPFLVAALELAGGGAGHYGLIGIFQAAASAALVPATFAIARIFAPTRVAGLAASLIAIHPALILYAANVHEFTFDALVATLTLLAAIESDRLRRRAALAGLTGSGAVAALARPTLAAFAFLASVVLSRVPPRRGALLAATLVVAMSLVWPVRNLLVLGPGSGSPYTCMLLWIGNNPASKTGALTTPEGRTVFDSMDPALRAAVIGKPETEQGRLLCGAALAYVIADPWAALGRWAQRFASFWWFTSVAGAQYPPPWIDLYRPAYALEVLLAVVGAAVLWRRGSRVALAYVLLEFLTVSILQSLAYVEGRHRLLLEPALITLAAAGAIALLSAARILRVGAGPFGIETSRSPQAARIVVDVHGVLPTEDAASGRAANGERTGGQPQEPEHRREER